MSRTSRVRLDAGTVPNAVNEPITHTSRALMPVQNTADCWLMKSAGSTPTPRMPSSFSGLSIDSVGTLYQLEATATGLTAATSASFDIGIGAPDSVLISPASASLSALSETTALGATVFDLGGNVATACGGTAAAKPFAALSAKRL